MDAAPDKNVFQAIERQVIAKLADDNFGDEPGTGDAAGNRSGRRRRAGHAVLAIAASILAPHILMHFQPGGDMFQNRRHVFADAILRGVRSRRRSFRRPITPTHDDDAADARDPVRVAVAWSTRSDGWQGLGELEIIRRFRGRRNQVEQLSLTFSVRKPFTATPMNPPLIPSQLFQCRCVLLV